MPIDSDELKDVVLFQLRRNIIVFYKKYLSILEDIGKDHSIFKDRVSAHIPEELLDNMDYLTPDKYNYIRKKILDGGNEIYRELESMLEKVDFSLKKK
tara:strand:+ start:1459 stop:1752 length:294 start_codon:yes stop_codon:yes gene_type:complete